MFITHNHLFITCYSNVFLITKCNFFYETAPKIFFILYSFSLSLFLPTASLVFPLLLLLYGYPILAASLWLVTTLICIWIWKHFLKTVWRILKKDSCLSLHWATEHKFFNLLVRKPPLLGKVFFTTFLIVTYFTYFSSLLMF